MAPSRRLRSLVTLLGLLVTASSPSPALAAEASRQSSSSAAPAHAHAPAARERGLAVSIDQISPTTLTPGERLHIAGVVVNVGQRGWGDAQIYLDIGRYPATTLADLETFAKSGEVFSTRIVEYGLFDEIGKIPAGTRKSFELSIPYGDLPIVGGAGVYNVGVVVIAGVGEKRDQEPEARAETLVPLLPRPPDDVPSAPLVTMVPITGPVARDSDGLFLDDRLAEQIGFNGRLRNVVDFALAAPTNSLQIALDPALHDAVSAMGEGYEVQSTLRAEPVEGAGEEAASQWLADLDAVLVRQDVLLLPWGTPAASELVANRVAGVVAAAVPAAAAYSDGLPTPVDVVGWQPAGVSSKRGLVTLRTAGTALQLVSEKSLPRLDALTGRDAPPSSVVLDTSTGPLTAIVVRDDIAGHTVRKSTSVLTLRQYLMAEATVQALSGRDSPVVVGLPFSWDPGPDAPTTDVDTALSIPTLAAQPATSALQPTAIPYDARVRVPADAPELGSALLDRIKDLRRYISTYLGVLADTENVEVGYQRQLALAGSGAWLTRSGRGRVLVGREVRLLRGQLREITVAVPAFVALSSGSGPFPVTVSNGLDVPIIVRLSVVPQNPALQIDAIDELRLEPGQQRDVQVQAHADGSGLTPVRVQLATPEELRFGRQWEVDVRATQIGLAIWIVMGVGLVILVGAAIVRIIRRLRTPGSFSPREEPLHP